LATKDDEDEMEEWDDNGRKRKMKKGAVRRAFWIGTWDSSVLF
jgi:hypothetical protein